MIRRFVNIVAEDCRSGVYSLHRLDVSNHLFYPSTAGAQAANAAADGTTMETLPELPAPCARIQPAPTAQASSSKMAFFGLLSPRRILCVDRAGHALVIDDAGAAAHSTIIAPTTLTIYGKGRWPILISVAAAASPADHRTTTSSSCCKVEEEDLYVMARSPRRAAGWGSCFDVLRAGTWQWEPLPPPPLVFDDHGYDTYDPATVWSHASDTYDHHHLCWTPELSATATDRPPPPPELHGVWQDPATPENWSPTAAATLISLGSGRFCIARLFVVKPEAKRDTTESRRCCHCFNDYYYMDDDDGFEIAVFTGVEIGKGTAAQGGLKVIKHKSLLYKLMDDRIEWIG